MLFRLVTCQTLEPVQKRYNDMKIDVEGKMTSIFKFDLPSFLLFQILYKYMIPSGSGLISSPISSFSPSNRNETLLLNVLWFMSSQMICRVLILTDISSYLRIIHPLIVEIICRLISAVNNRCSPCYLFSVILNHEY